MKMHFQLPRTTHALTNTIFTIFPHSEKVIISQLLSDRYFFCQICYFYKFFNAILYIAIMVQLGIPKRLQLFTILINKTLLYS